MEPEYGVATSSPATTSSPPIPANGSLSDQKRDGRYRNLFKIITFPIVSLARPLLRQFRSVSRPPLLAAVTFALKTSGLLVVKQRCRLPLLWPAIQLLSASHLLPFWKLRKWTPLRQTTDLFQVIICMPIPYFLFEKFIKPKRGRITQITDSTLVALCRGLHIPS